MDNTTEPSAHALLTIDEAADSLRVSYKTMEHWRSKAVGPAVVRLGPRRIRNRLSDLIAFIDANVTPPRANP